MMISFDILPKQQEYYQVRTGTVMIHKYSYGNTREALNSTQDVSVILCLSAIVDLRMSNAIIAGYKNK